MLEWIHYRERDRGGGGRFTEIVGYDHSEELLALGREKCLPRVDFQYFNLNTISIAEALYDLVTCFETLEHVGSCENAILNLHNHVADSGYLVIGVPNELGLPGIIKFLGRMALRKNNTYEDFFDGHSRLRYLLHLMADRPIDVFRDSTKPGYGPHLGFDYRKMEEYLRRELVEKRNWRLLDKRFTRFRMSVLYLLRKMP